MKDSGKTIKNMGMEYKKCIINPFIKATMQMENPKVKAISFGQMDKNMRGCGIRGSGTGQGRGLARKEIHIAENGRKEILMVMEFIQIKLEIYMKDNLNSA